MCIIFSDLYTHVRYVYMTVAWPVLKKSNILSDLKSIFAMPVGTQSLKSEIMSLLLFKKLNL